MKALIVLALLAPSIAAADERITDDTAYTMPSGKVRAGLWKVQYGVHKVKGLEIGTYTAPYASWAFDVKTFNAHVKYQFFDRNVWTFAAQLATAYVDLTGIDVDARIAIVPIQLLAAARLTKRLTLGIGFMYTTISGEGGYNEDETTEFRGAVAVSNAQSWLSLTMKLTPGWSLYFETRAIASTEAAGGGDLTHQLDDRTTVDVALTGSASVDELQGASTLVAAQWSSKRFRARLGIGYGNFNIPVINFVVPAALPFPELDIYFVF